MAAWLQLVKCASVWATSQKHPWWSSKTLRVPPANICKHLRTGDRTPPCLLSRKSRVQPAWGMFASSISQRAWPVSSTILHSVSNGFRTSPRGPRGPRACSSLLSKTSTQSSEYANSNSTPEVRIGSWRAVSLASFDPWDFAVSENGGFTMINPQI